MINVLISTFRRKAYSYPRLGYFWIKIIPKIYIKLGKYCRPQKYWKKVSNLPNIPHFLSLKRIPPPRFYFYDHIWITKRKSLVSQIFSPTPRSILTEKKQTLEKLCSNHSVFIQKQCLKSDVFWEKNIHLLPP